MAGQRSELDRPTEEEQIRARLQDPDVQARIAWVKDRIARGEFGTPLRGEELREFLLEQQRQHVDPR